MPIIRSWQKVCVVFIAVWIVVGANTAAAQVFHGFFPFRGNAKPGSTSGIYIDIEINLANDSAVHLDYLSECTTQDNAYLQFYTEWGGYIDSVIASEIEMPFGPYPLTKGKYRVRLSCSTETMYANTYVGYKLTVTPRAASTFANDDEPDPGEDLAVDLKRSKSFTGTIGLGGYIGLKDTGSATCIQANWTDNCGIDTSDSYYFNIDKGVRLQFRLDYDKTFIDNPQFDYDGHDGGDLQLRIYYLKDGKYYKVTTFDDWRKSGDLSKQITTQSGGVFRVDIVGAFFRDAEGNPQPMPKDKSFGGYRLGVIVNGKPEPGEFLITVRKTGWKTKIVRDSNSKDQKQHYLDINFDVKSTFNTTQTIHNVAEVITPVIFPIPGKTKRKDRSALILDIVSHNKSLSCRTGKIDWSEFCNKGTNSGSTCTYMTVDSGPPGYPTISSHTTKNFNLSIPVTKNQFDNLDYSVQVVTLFTGSLEGNEVCYAYGTDFRPVNLHGLILLLND